jgi:hypothetical protein
MEDTDYDKRSALHLATVMGNVDAVDFLVEVKDGCLFC